MIISIAKEESLDFKHIGSETHRVTIKKNSEHFRKLRATN